MKNVILKIIGKLPEPLRRSFFHVAYHAHNERFKRFAYLYANAPNMFMALEEVRDRGASFETIIDVGAFKGDWSRRVNAIWPDARLIMIEPNAEQFPELSETASSLNAELLPHLLGARDGEEVEFHVMRSGSSVFPEQSGVPRISERRTLHTLDNLLTGSDVAGSIFLKIDAQGYELEILKGAPETLEMSDAVLLEVSLIQINVGAPILAEVIAFMDKAGFVSYEITEIHRRPLDRAMNQVDILFLKSDHPLLSDKRHWADDRT